ncbi:TetR family transcriptional regulator [Fictibacillus sp. Mic-4]|uniref:TetR family transcriptional regulator n=1 Tax=Fictibacillus TaxID=1329200 RepID=UPI00047E98AF|nr:TetR family transcriptional regulator [Fictibacillus gelatini]
MKKAQNDKYQKILQAARTVISEKGLDKTTISDIVKEAGVAQGTFYLYFSSKNALIPAIASDLFDTLLIEIKEKTASQNTIWDILHTVIEVSFSVTKSYKDVLVLCYSGLAIENTFEIWEKIYEPYYKWFEDQLHTAINQGEIPETINVKRTVRTIVLLIEHTAEQLYLSNVQEEAEEVKEHLFSFIQKGLK